MTDTNGIASMTYTSVVNDHTVSVTYYADIEGDLQLHQQR